MRNQIYKTLLLATFIILTYTAQATTTELDQGYNNLYNANFAAAHISFHNWMQAHPEDPLGPVSDAAAFLFDEFNRLGVLDIELFADDDRFTSRKRPTPNPEMRTRFDRRTQQADSLADTILKTTPNNAQALFAKTLVCGLRSDYAALIDKSQLTALRLSKQGTALAAQTLQANPLLYDAHLASGIENYMLSLKPAPVRFIVRMSGASTDKAKGISEVSITAERGHYLAPFAQLMLAVAELRDGNKTEAKAILADLAQKFPQNPLYARQLNRIH
jgi:hypothetical protein